MQLTPQGSGLTPPMLLSLYPLPPHHLEDSLPPLPPGGLTPPAPPWRTHSPHSPLEDSLPPLPPGGLNPPTPPWRTHSRREHLITIADNSEERICSGREGEPKPTWHAPPPAPPSSLQPPVLSKAGMVYMMTCSSLRSGAQRNVRSAECTTCSV